MHVVERNSSGNSYLCIQKEAKVGLIHQTQIALLRNIGHFIARRLMQHNSRTFTRVIIRIAMAAITVGVAVMILTTAVISGFKKEITEKIFGFWGHIHITDSNIARNFEVVPIEGNAPFYDSIRNISRLEYARNLSVFGHEVEGQTRIMSTKGGVKAVNPYIILPGVLSHQKQFHGVLLKGVDSTYSWTSMEGFLVQGKADVRSAETVNTPGILLSRPIADKMQVRLGQEVVMSFIMQGQQIKRRFVVNGIYKTGLEEYDKRLCLVDIKVLRSILAWPQGEVQGMEVILDDIRDMDVIAEYIYSEMLPAQYYAETVRQKFPSIFDWLNLQDINEEIIISLMILVAIINMVTVLLILILERTQMIGILTSLGMSHSSIRGIFLVHAGYIILYGLVMGNILGLSIAWLQQETGFIKLDEANYYLDSAPILLEWGPILWINAGTFAVTLVTLILPTYLVTRISPVKALRFS